MSQYDDEYDDLEDDDLHDDQDDDGEVRRSTLNPYGGRSSVRGAGIPQTPRPGAPPPSSSSSGSSSGSGITTPSPIRGNQPGSSTPGSSTFNRPGSPTPGSSSSGGASGGSSGGPQPYSRPGGGNFFSGGSSGGSGGSSSGSHGGSGLGGSSVPGRTPPPGGSSSSFSKPSTPTTDQGSRPGGLPNRPATGSDKDKRDDKGGIGSRLGGLGSKLPFGGGDKDKKDNKPSGSSNSPALSSRPGAPAQKQDAKGGFASRFGALSGKLPFGGGKDKQDNRPAGTTGGSGARPGMSGSPYGGSSLGSSGARPASSSTSSGSTGSGFLGGKLPFSGGASGSATGARPSAVPGRSAPKGASPSLSERLKSLNPFGGKKDDKSTRSRGSRTPKVDQTGLTLDNKLDILGVVMVLGSLVLLVSSLSPVKGALTETINDMLSQTFGWGAVGALLIIFAIGVWLIMRHFGDEAPVIHRTRLFGAGMLFLGILVIMQFVESFRYQVGVGQDYLGTIRSVFLPISADLGRGGGKIGGEIYFLLLSNFGEIGGFLVLLCWMIIAVMLTLNLSASELAIIVISLWRSFRDSQRHRAQARAAQQAQRQQALAASAQISVSKPGSAQPESLSGGASHALPAPTQAQLPLTETDRSIPIRMGGRTFSASLRSGETVPLETSHTPSAPAAQTSLPADQRGGSATSAPMPAKPVERAGGFGSRLRGAIPLVGSEKNKPAEKAAEKPADKPETERGGLFNSIRSRIPAVGKPTEDTIEKEKETPRAVPRPEPEGEQARPTPGGVRDDALRGSAAAVSRFMQMQTPGEAQPRTADVVPPAPHPTEGETPDHTFKPAAFAPSLSTPSAAPVPKPPLRDASTPLGAAAADGKDGGDAKDGGDHDQDEAPTRLKDLLTSPRPYNRPPLTPTAPVPATAATERRDAPSVDKKDEQPTAPSASKADDPDARFRPPTRTSSLIIDDDDEDEDTGAWAKLPPAQPKGVPPVPRPAQSSSDSGRKPPIPDLQTRLNALRSHGSPTEKPDDVPKADDKPKAAPPTPAASKDEGKKSLISTFLSSFAVDADDEESPEAAAPAPEKAASAVDKQENQKPSPAFGKPDTPAYMVSRATPTRSDSGTSASQGAPPPPPPPARTASTTGATAVAAAPEPPQPPRRAPKEWKMPDFAALLQSGQDQKLDHDALLERARTIEETLESFGAPGRVVEVRTGPVITQFGVEPDYVPVRNGKKIRVKVSAIAALDKDIQLALGAKSIRVEAPVPGKGYVGIEVPNDQSAIVRLRDVLESKEFRKIQSPLTIALGQSVDGTPVAGDLASMPHLLIAGTTGSGKSVCVNAIIASLLLKNPPSRLKFIMVDPKRVELTQYNGIPHLVAPVVTELERIVSVLKWVTREMDERYRRFSNAGARNIEDFNRHLAEGAEPLPYIVVIIDELADLMMLAPDETERVITRIAALARATGIHLVIATQRPSVDVVTGLIKANFPARIAFAVASGTDSRVILDHPGAERLLGRGDMLYMSGDSPAPVRLQGVYVSDAELGVITQYWRSQMSQEDLIAASRPLLAGIAEDDDRRGSMSRGSESGGSRRQQAFWDSDDQHDDDDDGDTDDAMYEEAVEMVRRLNKASVSLLQRRLRIGYTRAARLIDMMEERGVVGPATEGSKPREVLPRK